MAKKTSTALIPAERIERAILLVRGQKVMLDSDLASLYGVDTGQLVRAVKRNVERFPDDFAFPLTQKEFTNLTCQIGISSSTWGGRRTLPNFGEHNTMFETFTLKHEITYGQLHQLLRDLGFSEHFIERPGHPQCHGFRYGNTDLTFNLAVHDSSELALPRDVGYIRRMLDMKGLLETAEFDRWMATSEQRKEASVTG